MDKRNYTLLFIGSVLSVIGLLIGVKYIMKYFTIKELTATNTGLPNVPNDVQISALKALVKNVLDPARELFKGTIGVTSGFRSPEVNKAIGGVATSQHLKGEAADLTCSDKAKLFALIRNNLPFDQLIWEKGNDVQPAWIHVSFKANGNNRKQVLKLKPNGQYVTLI